MVQFIDNASNTQLDIYNVNGQIIHSQVINGSTEVKFNTVLQSGIYLLKASTANDTYVQKLIVK